MAKSKNVTVAAVEETAVATNAHETAEFHNFGPTSDAEQAALEDRIDLQSPHAEQLDDNATSLFQGFVAVVDDVDEQSATDPEPETEDEADVLARLALAEEQAQRDERTRLREIERELARQRAVKFSFNLARTITASASTLKYEGKPIVGAWSNNGSVLVMLSAEKQVTLYVDEYDLREYMVTDAIRAQAEANGHEPSSWTWGGELGRISGCLLCDAMVRIGEDGLPRVDAYNKRCSKAAPVDQGKRPK